MLIVVGAAELGKNYFVSAGFGAQLFKEHQLITSGPYAIVCHPMYTALFLAALGGLLLYLTRAMLVFSLYAPLTAVRAWHEEQELAGEFGEQWKDYCKRVPAFIPRLRKE